jgi:hypothetical protein
MVLFVALILYLQLVVKEPFRFLGAHQSLPPKRKVAGGKSRLCVLLPVKHELKKAFRPESHSSILHLRKSQNIEGKADAAEDNP